MAIIETVGGTINSTKQFAWANGAMREARNASAVVTGQYFTGGESLGGINYLFTGDKLGSIREMTSTSGVVQAQFSYDPFGRATQVQGSIPSDFQFASYYFHGRSGLGQDKEKSTMTNPQRTQIRIQASNVLFPKKIARHQTVFQR